MTNATRRPLDDPKFSLSQTYFELACSASRTHSEAAAEALAEYGDHGADISGCVRDHFPDSVKADLRFWAREVSRFSALARKHRPKYVRDTTLNRLAALVATRDGSGFYGPQPMRAA